MIPDLAHLGSINLETLIGKGQLLSRFDSKHLIGDDDLSHVFDAFGADALVLRHDGITAPQDGPRYETRYFDTPDLRTYRDHLMGRRRRFKVRVRRYVDTNDTFFEIKARFPRGQIKKYRWQVEPADAAVLLTSAEPLSAEWAARTDDLVRQIYGLPVPPTLVPTLHVVFNRLTFYVPGTDERATLDSNIAMARVDDSAPIRADASVHVLEVKSAVQRCSIDRGLLRSGLRPEGMSKYCLGLGLLTPELRINPWRSLLKVMFPGEVEGHPRRRVA